jgi:hypothetical protein
VKPEAQQIAIAEARGWTEIREQDYTPFGSDPYIDGPEQIWIGKNPETEEVEPLPDCLNDLNAMHEAEKVLTEEQRIAYSDCTYHIALKAQKETGKWRWISLTAAQRAEAFLRTIGKWEEAEQ